MTTLQPGDSAPDFTLTADSGRKFRLSAQRGHPVVLYFYPEDLTEGCTIENIEFTDELPAFKKLGVTVVGISPDSVEKHCNFRDRYDLKVPLLADPEHKAVEPYGLWQLKKLYGREYMGLIRTSFLIDAEGRVAGVFPARRIKGHAAKVLEAARELVASAKSG